MPILKNKIDFAVVIDVKNANPNGDPVGENRPRTDNESYGEISDVCLKWKIRNRLMQEKCQIFVQSEDNRKDEYKSLKERFDAFLGEQKNIKENKDKIAVESCKKWFDVRAFGQVFAFKAVNDKSDNANEETGGKSSKKGVSIGVRGAVSVQPAFSIDPVNVTAVHITKSVNSETTKSGQKGSDTMGMKYRVDYGRYVLYGSINSELSNKNNFSEEDAEALRNALITLFRNDASAARPEGSVEVAKVFWWKHNCSSGQYSSAKVFKTLSFPRRNSDKNPKSADDYAEIVVNSLPGLEPIVYDGE
ncbi:MAG: type I-C CRISPR-associated protein Cas7/Csd2 [Clostridiaceae bacterium]|jgi:CRISPR-associated protein Csd2|nr:type I-C CRISPR-associated protein Cas7/Csd2 [Clostridiaceae bacterium]